MEARAGRKWEHLIINANLATMAEDGEAYGAILDGALAIHDQAIAWLGPMADLPDAPSECAKEVYSATGQWITPGLIDCHTHLIFAGNRAREFEQRLQGVSYAEIARRGGGIASTVKATRETDESELVELAAARMRHLRSEGVTTVEIKSGYGLNVDTELRMLRAARRLDERQPIDIQATFLGAHAVPAEYKDDVDGYVDLIVNEMLPTVAEQGLAEAVDGYCETIAFSREQIGRVFQQACNLGLPVKLHADQLSDTGGAALAASFAALSADHLEYTSEAGIEAMAKSCQHAVTWRTDGAGLGLQSGLFAVVVNHYHPQLWLRVVWHDAGGKPARRNHQCRTGSGTR
jgi:imidazolonepropionase